MIQSFIPTHPGEVLKDELEYRGISQKEFADGLDMVKKIDADDIEVYLKLGDEAVSVTVGLSTKEENCITVYGKEETVKKVSATIQKMLG